MPEKQSLGGAGGRGLVLERESEREEKELRGWLLTDECLVSRFYVRGGGGAGGERGSVRSSIGGRGQCKDAQTVRRSSDSATVTWPS